MTNKSIGNFLAELRREKGLTQRDLADYLNVSDKTVSHWECDKYSPDISTIPLLAEFFGVTCDEILRGERKATEGTAEAHCNEIAENTEAPYNENNFSYEPLTKEREYAKYARIRLHNAFSRLKLTHAVAIFTAIALWAVLYTVIQLIEHKIAIHNFEAYASIGAGAFSAVLGGIIIFSAQLRFMSMLNMCPFEEVEFIKWRRMARSILIVPVIIIVLICIVALAAFMPLYDVPYIDTETMPLSDYLENEGYYEVDPSEVISGEAVASPQSEGSSQEGYISGEVTQ